MNRNKKNIKVTCDNCGSIYLHGKEITVIYNFSTGHYTFAFTCCGERQVRNMSPEEAVVVLRNKANFMTTCNPELSYRVGGDPIDEIDLADFRVALNTHDHLAAYA